jgi:hypothetical protein
MGQKCQLYRLLYWNQQHFRYINQTVFQPLTPTAGWHCVLFAQHWHIKRKWLLPDPEGRDWPTLNCNTAQAVGVMNLVQRVLRCFRSGTWVLALFCRNEVHVRVLPIPILILWKGESDMLERVTASSLRITCHCVIAAEFWSALVCLSVCILQRGSQRMDFLEIQFGFSYVNLSLKRTFG